MSFVTLRFLRRALGAACMTVALAAESAHAVELFQWLDADGVVSIGPNPPPGASAVPYAPGQANAPTPALMPTPTPLTTPGTTPAARPVTKSEVPCATYTDAARNAATRLRDAEREIARLEAKLEELDASDLAYARTECVSHNLQGPNPDCRATTFDRDKEITRSENALAVAEVTLADAEGGVRDAEIPARCQKPASAD